jgi:molybdate transport system substrate-binding protein
MDVFASADPKNMDDVSSEVNTPQNFATNTLTVILPAKNPGNIQTLKDLANQGVTIAVGDPSHPIGGYTLDVLSKMGKSSEYGPSYESAVKGNFVTQETSVSGIVQKVILGEVDAGYVYVSDGVAQGAEVKSIEIPKQFNIVADYPIATGKHTPNPTLAESFVSTSFHRRTEDPREGGSRPPRRMSDESGTAARRPRGDRAAPRRKTSRGRWKAGRAIGLMALLSTVFFLYLLVPSRP